MDKVTKITPAAVNTIALVVLEAMREHADGWGVSFERAGGSVNGGVEAALKFRIRVLDQQATGDAERNAFCAYAQMFGLGLEHYKARFIANEEWFELVGIVPSRPRFPMQGRRVRDGRPFKFQESIIPRLLPRTAA